MRIPIWMVALGVAGIAASGVGCSGGDDDDDDDDGSSVQTGSYTVSATAGPDECDIANTFGGFAFLDSFEILSITATQASINLGGSSPATFVRTGDNLHFEVEVLTDSDWSEEYPTLTCTETDTYSIDLTIASETSLDIAEALTYEAVAGSAADCVLANNSFYGASIASFPCENTSTGDAVHD